MIFHSYVKLPDGTFLCQLLSQEFGELVHFDQVQSTADMISVEGKESGPWNLAFLARREQQQINWEHVVPSHPSPRLQRTSTSQPV